MSSFILAPSLSEGVVLQNDPSKVRVFAHTMPTMGLRLMYHRIGDFSIQDHPEFGCGILYGSAMTGPEYDVPLPPEANKCEAWSVTVETRTDRTAAFGILRWGKSLPVRYAEAEAQGPFEGVTRVRSDGSLLVLLERGSGDPIMDEIPEIAHSACEEAVKTDACGGILRDFVGRRAVVWKSGMMGGEFATYYGVDSKDKPNCLVIDFNMLKGGLLGPHVPMTAIGEDFSLVKKGK